jgi:hypothetical protein
MKRQKWTTREKTRKVYVLFYACITMHNTMK